MPSTWPVNYVSFLLAQMHKSHVDGGLESQCQANGVCYTAPMNGREGPVWTLAHQFSKSRTVFKKYKGWNTRLPTLIHQMRSLLGQVIGLDVPQWLNSGSIALILIIDSLPVKSSSATPAWWIWWRQGSLIMSPASVWSRHHWNIFGIWT